MLVLASTVLTVVIVVAVVVVLLVLLIAFGPLSRSEQVRDDTEAEMGTLGVAHIEEPEDTSRGAGGLDAEERLDREFE